MKSPNLIKRVLLALTLSLAAMVAASVPREVTVTATIDNYVNGTSTPYSLQSDGYPSATYSGDFTPTADTSGPNYFQLNLDLSKSRAVVLTLNPLDGSPAPPFTGPLALPGSIVYSRCFTPSGGYQDWTQIQQATPDGNCSMRVNFTYERVNYSLVMSPEYPGTGTAIVTCTIWSTSANSCVAWTDVPNSNSANPNVALLLNKSNGESHVGFYSLSFNVTLTHP